MLGTPIGDAGNGRRRGVLRSRNRRATIRGSTAHHAGFAVLALASLIDIVALGAPAYLVVSLFFDFDWFVAGIRDESTGWSDLLNTALLVVVTVVLWVKWDGRIPGKRLTRIRIVSWPGYGSFGYGTALLRSLIGVLSAAPLMIGYLVISFMVALRPDKRGYHDLLARTCVVHD